MLLGHHAQKNIVSLTQPQRELFLQKTDLPLTAEQVQYCTGTGYVMVHYERHCLGVGLYFEARDGRPPMLRSLFPQYLR